MERSRSRSKSDFEELTTRQERPTLSLCEVALDYVDVPFHSVDGDSKASDVVVMMKMSDAKVNIRE